MAIVVAWETQVLADVPELSVLSKSLLIDHLPEFIESLAQWLSGEEHARQEGYRALSDGHALSRQRAGVPIDVLMAEYSTLRRVLVEAIMRRISGAELAPALVSLNEALDLSINEAVRRYVGARDEVRERFVAILGHDLRDPLSAIQLSASVLATRPLPEVELGLVRRIVSAASRMERLVSDVLDFARGRLGGGIPVKLGRADLGEICREAVADANAGGNVAIRFEATGDLVGVFDADRIRQALSNLLRNAWHHGGGDVELKTWESEDRKKLFTTVTNRGPAISPELLMTLFEPFKRQRDPQRRGLGLGLYIVREIVRAHGGVCGVQSSEDATVFTIEWPRIPFDEVPER